MNFTQITSDLIMIRPKHFNYNVETAKDNYFQKKEINISTTTIQKKVRDEFNSLVEIIKKEKIKINIFEDKKNIKTTDSVFPNNWISFHEDGKIIIYPMFSENRRKEKRKDIIDTLKNKGYKINEIIDLSKYENENKFLEGTGSMILDRQNRICYAAISSRTSKDVLNYFCKKNNYKPISFKAYQTYKKNRKLIYHTNVMMCIGEQYAIVCLASIDNENEKKSLKKSLIKTNKIIIEITEEQCQNFVGNMLQVKNIKNEKFLIMSSRAFKSLTNNQRKILETYNKLLHSELQLIEKLGGGGARCMIAENFLQKK